MYIPGHLSVGYLLATGIARYQGRTPYTYTEVLPILLGTLTPDIIDKSLLFLDASAYGRTVGHSLMTLVVLAMTFVAIRLLRPVISRAYGFWVLGIWAHLVTDLVDDAAGGILHSNHLVGSWFLWPFLTPDDLRFTPPVALFPGHSFHAVLEIAVVAVAVGALWWNWRDGG